MQQLLLVCRASVSAPLAVCCTDLPHDVVCKIVVPLSKQPLVLTFYVWYVSLPLHKLSRMLTGESVPSTPSAQVILQRHTHRLPNRPDSLKVQNKMTIMSMKRKLPHQCEEASHAL